MKLVATILVAAFVVAAGMSVAFADCAGHTKAQMVKSDDPQISSDRAGQSTDAGVPAVPEKVAQQTKSRAKPSKKSNLGSQSAFEPSRKPNCDWQLGFLVRGSV